MDLGAFFQLLFGLIATILTLLGIWFKCPCIKGLSQSLEHFVHIC